MTNKVGTKGQIVIEKRIRDQLGIAPGSVAFQAVVDDHVEVHFFPPGHTRSLYGILRDSTDVSLSDEELEEAIDNAQAEVAVERYERTLPQSRRSGARATARNSNKRRRTK